MNKKFFSLIGLIALLNAAMPTFCGNPEKIDNIIEGTIKLGQKQSYENNFFMERDREQQKNMGITPNAQEEEFFLIDKATYIDRRDHREKNWKSVVPLAVQQYCIDKCKKLNQVFTNKEVEKCMIMHFHLLCQHL